jgi:hypothetical protein
MNKQEKQRQLEEWQEERLQKFQEQGITFRLAIPDDAQALADFHNQEYGTQRTAQHWLWEYQTYAPEKSLFRVAVKDGQIIATNGTIPIYIEVAGGTRLASKGESWLCLPQYRGTGLMQAMDDWVKKNGFAERFDISFGLTNIDKHHGRFSFAIVCRDIQIWTRPGNPKTALTLRLRNDMTHWHGTSSLRRIASTSRLVARALISGKNGRMPQINVLHGYELRRGQTSVEDLQELHQRLLSKNEDTIWIKYDSNFLNWRMRQHPFKKYDEYQVYQGDMLLAYAFTTEQEGEVCISDLLSEDKHATSLLLSTILDEYANRAVRYRFLGNPMDRLSLDLFRQLPLFGFSLAMKWNLTIWDNKAALGTEFFKINNWHVNGLWTEGFLY